MGYLNKLYEKDVDRIINYISFKLDCAREQEEVKCKINKELVKKSLKELEDLREQKTEIIKRVMPKKVIFKTVSKPQKMYLKNGSLSSLGEKWMSLLQSQNLPQDYDNSVSYVISEEVGNPNSKDQLKDWLFSIGWKPITFEYRVNKAGETKEVPQIYNKIGVCNSVKELYKIVPELENLDLLSKIIHRIGVFSGMLEKMDNNNYLKSEISGFTNTLRFKHLKPINFTVGLKQL